MGEFPEDVVKQAWARAGAHCECARVTHDHDYTRCNKELVWENRGRETGIGAWEAHHKVTQDAGGEPILSNCEILCWNCHSKTF